MLGVCARHDHHVFHLYLCTNFVKKLKLITINYYAVLEKRYLFLALTLEKFIDKHVCVLSEMAGRGASTMTLKMSIHVMFQQQYTPSRQRQIINSRQLDKLFKIEDNIPLLTTNTRANINSIAIIYRCQNVRTRVSQFVRICRRITNSSITNKHIVHLTFTSF